MHLLSLIPWDEINVDRLVENSFKDFHAKGLDYLCLGRTNELTLKAYFFEGDAQDAGEVVNPHDHRYPFATQCFSGRIRNKWYVQTSWADENERYNMFEWRTPLNGGNGFTQIGRCPLREMRHGDAAPGERYWMEAEEFHTVQVLEPDTVIVLLQFADVIPLDEPTLTFTQSDEPPDLSGLYGKFTADQAVKRLRLLQDLAGKLD